MAFIVAFGTVYLVWGSTYLAIRVAVEAWPPFLMAGARFVVAGTLLFGWLLARGAAWPSKLLWRNSAITGLLLLGGGNGLVAWAEQSVSSSFAALLIATVPAWFAMFEWIRPGGIRPALFTVLGILVGFAGVVLLLESGVKFHGAASYSAWGIVALVAATMCWAGGSVFSKHTARPASPYMAAAMQMITGGVSLLAISAILGEPARFQWARIVPSAWAAFIYLVVVGSWAGFSAYAWMIRHASPAKVSTYAYVNPAVAVFLGWACLGEPLTPPVLLAVAIIISGVALITLNGSIRLALKPRTQSESA